MPRMVNEATGVVVNVSDDQATNLPGFRTVANNYVPAYRTVTSATVNTDGTITMPLDEGAFNASHTNTMERGRRYLGPSGS